MVQKSVVFLGLIMSATCMYLHEVPLYLPIQYQEPTPDYNFAYEVNDAHTGDYKRQQETRIGDTVLGAYSLLQPDGLTRTVVYRADDHSGFNAEVNNVGRQNVQVERQNIQAERQNIQAERQNIQAERREDRQQENGDAGGQTESRPHAESQPRQANHQQATAQPSTIAHTSLVHHVLRKWK